MEAVIKDERIRNNQQQKSQRRLSKQEEVDFGNDGNFNGQNQVISDNGCVVPVTIHVEDRGDDVFPEVDNVYKSGKRLQLEDCFTQDFDHSSSMHLETSRQSVSFSNQLGCNGEVTGDKDKKRNKVLIRSKALSDDASPPPPEIDTLKVNTNRLSVTNSSAQSQKSGSVGSSQGSNDGSSPSLSRDSSTETYTDSTGTDLQQFLLDTLQNPKDRIHLLKIEQDLTALVKDSDRQFHKFPQMSSYHRMLVHRIAAFFGMEHNVDTTGNAVIVNKSKSTRLPDLKFREYAVDGSNEEPKKLILKRDSASLEENSGQSNNSSSKEKSPDRRGCNSNLGDTRRSKSFEEREEQYEKARARIFNQGSSSSETAEANTTHSSENEYFGVPASVDREHKTSSPVNSQDDKSNWNSECKQWSSTDSDCSGRPHHLQLQKQNRLANSLDSDTTKTSITTSSSMSSSSGMFLTPDSCISDRALTCNQEIKPSVTKASSFGGITVLNYESNLNSNSKSRLTKAGSFNVSRSNDANFNSSAAFNPTLNLQELKQHRNQTQTQPVSVQLPQSSHVPASASHSNATMQRKQWTSSIPNPVQQSPPQPQHVQHQQQSVQMWPNQVQSWTGYNTSNSTLVYGNAMVDQSVRDDKSMPASQAFVAPVGGYLQQPSNGEHSTNIYRNTGSGDISKGSAQPMLQSGTSGPSVVYVPCLPHQQQQQFQSSQHAKHNPGRGSNQNRSLNAQFSAMTFNQQSREVANRGDNSYSAGKGDNCQKQSYAMPPMPGSMVRPPNTVLPMSATGANGQIPMCYMQPLQHQNVGGSPTVTMTADYVYPNAMPSNLMFLSSNAGVGNQFHNSMPVQLQQIPVPIPQTQAAVPSQPPPSLPSQSQVLRNMQPNVQQQAVQYTVPYQFVNQMHASTSQVGTASYPYGAPVKVSHIVDQYSPYSLSRQQQVPPCLPVYVVSNGNNMSGNQGAAVRPMTQTGLLLPTPYAQRPSWYRTPSPPQTAATPPLALPANGASQYLGYTLCTPPPTGLNSASAPAVNSTAFNQINAATQTFMSMLRAQAAAAALTHSNCLANPLNQGGLNKRFPAPNQQLIQNSMQRLPELPEFHGSNSNNYKIKFKRK